MAEIRKILFAFEIAEISREIAAWVELIGRRFEAEVHLLHVVPRPEYFPSPYAAPPERMDDEEELKRKAREKVDQFAAEHLEMPVKSEIRTGKPVDAILGYIESEGISMVVVGTHGRTGLDRMIFGSVTDRILRLSPVPVLCIGPAERRRKEGER